MIEYYYCKQEMRAYDEQREKEKLSKDQAQPPTKGQRRPRSNAMR
jgi:hypothetical protein